MSALASKKEAEVAAALPVPEEPLTLTESEHAETMMAYDPSSRMPVLVIVIWACALVGFGTYLAMFLFPDLAAWGKP